MHGTPCLACTQTSMMEWNPNTSVYLHPRIALCSHVTAPIDRDFDILNLHK